MWAMQHPIYIKKYLKFNHRIELTNLIYIESHFNCLPLAFKNLQELTILLSNELLIVEEIVGKIMNLEKTRKLESKKKTTK